MPIPSYCYTFGLEDDDTATRLIYAAGRYMNHAEDLLAASDLSAASLEKMPEVLHAKTGIRFWAFELVIEHCLEEKPEYPREMLVDTLTLGRSLIQDRLTSGSKGLFKRLSREVEYFEIRLCYLWQPVFTPASPCDELFWRRYSVQENWPQAHVVSSQLLQYLNHKYEFECKSDPPRASVAERPDKWLLPGQREAMAELRTVLSAKKAGLSAAGITPVLHVCITGPSGSGKTHVVRTFAKSEGLDLFELSIASWMPQGSRTHRSTVRKIADHIQRADRSCIYLDELDKLRPRQQTCEFTRYLIDEVMSVLDGRVEYLEGWNANLAEKLRSECLIIGSGAWQDAYEMAFVPHRLLGGTWDSVSIAESFMEENWLPTELLARLSTMLIEVRPPSQADIVEWVARIHCDMKAPAPADGITRVAREIYEARTGMRALEAYVVSLFSHQQRETNGDGPEKGGDL